MYEYRVIHRYLLSRNKWSSNICKGADIEKGLSIHGAEAEQSRDRVVAWANKFV